MSLDNLIVFGMISTALKVEHKLQRRILNYGIVGAILFQLVFILGGYELLKQIFWVSIIFGVACVLSRSAWRARRISRSTKSKMWWVLSVLLPIHHSFDGHKLMTVVKASA